jgi:phosphoglycerol transferase MdoB-like AlkP superfamily enzyme
MNVLKKVKLVFQLLLSVVCANVLAASMQYASLKPYHDSFLYWASQHFDLYAFSAAILFAIVLGLWALFNNMYLSIVLSSLAVGALDCSQYFKIKILGEPVYPWDLNQLKNMGEMMKIVRNFISPALLIAVGVLGLFILCATYWLPRNKMALPLRMAFMVPAVVAILACTHLQTPVMAKSLEKMGVTDYHWNQEQNYMENGFMLGFLSNIGAKIENQPADYSQAALQQIVQTYSAGSSTSANASDAEKPNIVYVMDESLFDPTRLTNLSFSEDPMSNMHQYQNTYATGWSLSPVFGGGTSNVEFEALTGMNMSFINEGAVPYQQVLAKKNSFPSLVSLLKARGYETTAVHPFDKTFYNRNRVYPVLGFDQFISQDNIKYTDKLSSNGYISDMSAVKQVVDVLNSSDQPHFVHLVTMQNHLPILPGMNGPNTIKVNGLQGSGQTEMESYAQSVKETDKAVKYLVDSIQQMKRPTIVVVFGDHLPSLDSQTYAPYLSTLTPAQQEEFRHQTPLVVAANFTLKDKQLGTLAPSFFGPLVFELTDQPLPPYYQLLEKIKNELPGVSPDVYVDSQGTPTLNLSAEQKKLLHDYELVQYDLLYGQGYAKSMLR